MILKKEICSKRGFKYFCEVEVDLSSIVAGIKLYHNNQLVKSTQAWINNMHAIDFVKQQIEEYESNDKDAVIRTWNAWDGNC